jgi:splicing factor 3B subunit 2
MTVHGDTYYEGKEDEVKMRSYKPGKVSSLLRTALGINEFSLPPWIINMQRFGPPPAYPHLKIQGLNNSLGTGMFGNGVGNGGIGSFSDPSYSFYIKNAV